MAHNVIARLSCPTLLAFIFAASTAWGSTPVDASQPPHLSLVHARMLTPILAAGMCTQPAERQPPAIFSYVKQVRLGTFRGEAAQALFDAITEFGPGKATFFSDYDEIANMTHNTKRSPGELGLQCEQRIDHNDDDRSMYVCAFTISPEGIIKSARPGDPGGTVTD